MEDPITFDVWALAKVGCIDAAAEALGRVRPENSPSDLRKHVTYSVTTNAQIQFASNLRWSEVQDLTRNSATWAKRLTICQYTYTPDEKYTSGYCRIHNLVYGGSMGCHVCSGFYEP